MTLIPTAVAEAPTVAAPPAELPRGTKVGLLLVITASLAVGAVNATHYQAGPDEFEHLHAAWLWQGGLRPYMDFFEHHPPLFWLVLRPMIQHDSKDLLSLVVTARLAGWLISAMCLAAGWWMFRSLWGRPAAWWGTAALAVFSAVAVFFFEVRPDGASLALLLAGTAASLEGMGLTAAPARRQWWRPALGGLLLSASVVMLPKSVFWVVGLGLVLTAVAAIHAIRGERRMLMPLLLIVLGGLVPVALQLLWIFTCNDWSTFVFHNVTANRKLIGSSLKTAIGLSIIARDLFRFPMVSLPLALAGLGMVMAHREPLGRERKAALWAMLAGAVVVIVLGNGPWPQYQMELQTLVAGLSGVALATMTQRLQGVARNTTLIALGVLTPLWLVAGVFPPDQALGGKPDFDGCRTGLEQSVCPLRRVLDKARPGDTCLSVALWTPVLMMDADPRLFMKTAVYSGDEVLWEYERVIDRPKLPPRFIVGNGIGVWTGQGKMSDLYVNSPLLGKYRMFDERPPFVLERYEMGKSDPKGKR